MKEKKIVIVEDESGLSDSLEQKFTTQGAWVTVINNGDDAARAVEQLHPDLVVLDLMLPGTTGEFVLQEIRQIDCCGTVPVLVLTNFTDVASIQQQAAESDILEYMVKANSSLSDITKQVETMLNDSTTTS